MKSKAVIFDIDGVILEGVHRHKYLLCPPEQRDFKKFLAEVPNDMPIRAGIEMLVAMHKANYRIILLTGRNENRRELTEQSLRKHNVPYHALYMRPQEEIKEDYLVKQDIFSEINSKYDVIFAVDDRQENIGMFSAMDIPVYHFPNPNADSYNALAELFCKENPELYPSAIEELYPEYASIEDEIYNDLGHDNGNY